MNQFFEGWDNGLVLFGLCIVWGCAILVSSRLLVVEKVHGRFDDSWRPDLLVVTALYTCFWWFYAIVRTADVVGDRLDERRRRRGY